MRMGWRIYAIWACFAARLLFYATALPLWEGFDEWAHFAVIRIMATRGVWLVPRDAPAPRDVAESLSLVPVSKDVRDYLPSAVTQDVYWTLPIEERARSEAAVRDMPVAWQHEDGPPSLQAYEALQPPLYYWLMTPVARLLDGHERSKYNNPTFAPERSPHHDSRLRSGTGPARRRGT